MFCLKCGKEIPDYSAKCPFCGAPTENGDAAVETGGADPAAKSSNLFGLLGIVCDSLGTVLFLDTVLSYLSALSCNLREYYTPIEWLHVKGCLELLLFGIAGLVLALIGRRANRSDKRCKVALIISVVLILCGLILIIL